MTAGTNDTVGLPVSPGAPGLKQSPVTWRRVMVMTSGALIAVLLVYEAARLSFDAVLCRMLSLDYRCVCQAPPHVALNRDAIALAGMRGR